MNVKVYTVEEGYITFKKVDSVFNNPTGQLVVVRQSLSIAVFDKFQWKHWLRID